MNKQEFIELLKTKCPSLDGHITSKQKVDLPYIVVIENGTSNMFTDNYTFYEITNYSFVLHQAKRDYVLEEGIKSLLNENQIPYEITDVEWDETYLLWALTFDVRL